MQEKRQKRVGPPRSARDAELGRPAISVTVPLPVLYGTGTGGTRNMKNKCMCMYFCNVYLRNLIELFDELVEGEEARAA